MQKFNNKINWKRRFIILCALNGLAILFLVFYLYSPIPKTELELSSERYKMENSSQFIVRTTKQNLNNLVNAYLDKLLANTNHQYSINLDDDVQLFGELPMFSTTVPLLINLEPIVQENGDLILKQKSISVGQLQLPNKKIMQYVSKYLPVPDWVIINPREEEIYVKVTEMEIKSNFKVEVEHFDLEANNIAFKINVPYKTLGIDVIKETGMEIKEENDTAPPGK
ncbi:YpmS family protein [Pseudogracilibacillus sp. SO30301A]|uniref:YpmS family protein n=1 Tax=Pseudogracilibacillus sp. SO30301A TaxID=3098291 RepID=UPI00300DEFBE